MIIPINVDPRINRGCFWQPPSQLLKLKCSEDHKSGSNHSCFFSDVRTTGLQLFMVTGLGMLDFTKMEFMFVMLLSLASNGLWPRPHVFRGKHQPFANSRNYMMPINTYQILVNQGPDSTFVIEANIKSLCPKLSRGSILKTQNRVCSVCRTMPWSCLVILTNVNITYFNEC